MMNILKMLEFHNTTQPHPQTYENNHYTDYIILIIIGVIFFMVFVIQMTIFDFYKRPSIYEIELYNEFKKRNSTCNPGPGCNSTAPENSQPKEKTHNHNFYKDIVFFVLYINIMYILSFYLSDIFLILFGTGITLLLLFTKQSYITEMIL